MKADTKIRVAVIGLGHWGPNIVRTLIENINVCEVIGVEQSAERRALVNKNIPGLNIVDNFQTILDNSEVDAVVIATPTETHFRLASKALNAGKHVLVEKPLAHNSAAASELLDLAKQKGKILMTGHIFLYNQAIRKMKEIIKSGELGEVLYARSIRTNLGPIRTDVNSLWDLASHDLSIFDYLFDQEPRQVSCNLFSPLKQQQADIAVGSLEYNGNKAATFLVSWLDPIKTRQIIVVGDSKMLTFDDMQPIRPLSIFDKGVKLQHISGYSDTFHSYRLNINNGSKTEIDITTGEPLKNEINHFLDCIINGTIPDSDGKNGLRVVRLLEALDQSAQKHGAPVNF